MGDDINASPVFCVISRQAEAVLARASIWRPTDIELQSEMHVCHTNRVGGSSYSIVISRQAEAVLARASIWRPTEIYIPGFL